jgi:hypothetical protein
MGKENAGLPEIEIIKLINKRKKRYCAIALNDLEELMGQSEQFKAIRKIVLDNMNGFTRSVFTVIGIDVEGIKDD